MDSRTHSYPPLPWTGDSLPSTAQHGLGPHWLSGAPRSGQRTQAKALPDTASVP